MDQKFQQPIEKTVRKLSSCKSAGKHVFIRLDLFFTMLGKTKILIYRIIDKFKSFQGI